MPAPCCRRASSVLEAFLAGLRALKAATPSVAARLRVHFVGTGRSPDDPAGHQVLPRAREIGVEDMVDEHPQRIGYVDTLTHLTKSDAVLVLGSTEAHYTPSKVFQAMLSGRPVFAMLHRDSTAVDMIRSSGAGEVLTLTETSLPRPEEVAGALRHLLNDGRCAAAPVAADDFEALTARGSARALASALDRAVARAGAGAA